MRIGVGSAGYDWQSGTTRRIPGPSARKADRVTETPTTAPSVPMVDLRSEVEALWADISAAVNRVLRSGEYINGPEVRAFETEVTEYLGVTHAISVNSGTDALVIALRATGVGPGDDVITTPFTFFATIEAILHVGARPVFVDVAEDGFNLDVGAVEASLTPKTRAILPVHLFGEPVGMGPILALARRHGLVVVEDGAQAFGACYADASDGNLSSARVGTAGHAAAFSFYPTKTLGAFGDGGLVVTHDRASAEQARSLRNHASDPDDRYRHRDVGYNSRLDEIQAAVLRVKLPYVDRWNLQRRDAAKRYEVLLGEIPGVRLPASGPEHVFHQYTIRVPREVRAELRQRLNRDGIATSLFYPPTDSSWPRHLARAAEGCPRAMAAAQEAVSLPIYPSLSPRAQERVARAIRRSLA